jgi:hypothetical protein
MLLSMSSHAAPDPCARRDSHAGLLRERIDGRVGQYPLEQAAAALAQVKRGAHGAAIVLRPIPAG